MDSECRLLELPAELRNEIYRLALVAAEGMHIPGDGRLTTPWLLCTSKQIREETLKIYYSENTFTAAVNDSKPYGPAIWLENKPSGTGSLITNLSIEYTLHAKPEGRSEDKVCQPTDAVYDRHIKDLGKIDHEGLLMFVNGVPDVDRKRYSGHFWGVKVQQYLYRWQQLPLRLLLAKVLPSALRFVGQDAARKTEYEHTFEAERSVQMWLSVWAQMRDYAISEQPSAGDMKRRLQGIREATKALECAEEMEFTWGNAGSRVYRADNTLHTNKQTPGHNGTGAALWMGKHAQACSAN